MAIHDYLTVRTKSLNRISARVWHVSLGGMLLAAGGLIDEGNAAAQQTVLPNPNNVLANPAPATPLSTEWQQEQPDEMDVFQEAGKAQQNPVPQIFRFGPVTLHPHGDYSLMYSSGIQFAPGHQENSIIQSLSPGIRIDLGRRWAVDYTPTLQFYSSDKFQNVVNHAVSLTGNFDYNAWAFGLTHSSILANDPTAATGTQTEQDAHVTALTASRALNDKFSTSLALEQTINLVSGSENSYQWSTLDWLNYALWPRCTVGIGIGGGYDLIEADNSVSASQNLDQSFENVEADINWRATDKISLQLSGGFKYTQFNTRGTSDSLAPIFSAAVQYAPFKNTRLSLSASRTVGSSDYYILSQQVETTIVGLSLDQQLFRKFRLGLSVAYSTTDYNTSLANIISVGRTDDDVVFSARLSHPFFTRGTWAIFYQYSDNRSTMGIYSFSSNQTGFEIGYSF